MAATERLSHTETPAFSGPAATYDTIWNAQTFTTIIGFKITRVDIFGGKRGTPGNFTVEIRAVSGGVPVLPALISGTVDGNSFKTVGEGYQWETISFAGSFELSSNTVYAIVFSNPTGDDEGNYISTEKTFVGQGDTGYSDGQQFNSEASGVDDSWTSTGGLVDSDILFKLWGNDAPWAICNPPLPTGLSVSFGETGQGDPVYAGTPTGENTMITIRKLVAVADDKIWIEDV